MRFLELLLLACCATAVVGALSIVSVKDEIQLGREAQREVRRHVPELRDDATRRYVADLGRRLAAKAGGPKYPYSFSIANDRALNAFALPGGPVWIHRGIIDAAADESQLAGVLAHELGHSLHSCYSWQTQPWIYSDYSMFVAEVASNMNQALMGAHLLETVDDPDFLITIIEERMGNNLRYLFTMPMLARFELDCHEKVERGEALTAEGMIETMANLYAEGFGDAVDLDRERQGITWARFPHLFANFYVFQYATGISAAAQLAAQVRSEGPEAAKRYFDFLKTGGSVYPVEALKRAGIDMSRPEPIQAAFDMLAGYVDRLEELVS